MRIDDIFYLEKNGNLVACICDEIHDNAVHYTQLDNEYICGIIDERDIRHVQINLFDKYRR